MWLEDKLFNRRIEGASSLDNALNAKENGDVEIGRNLEVDGKLKMNGGFEVLHTVNFDHFYLDVYMEKEDEEAGGIKYFGLIRDENYISYSIGTYYTNPNDITEGSYLQGFVFDDTYDFYVLKYTGNITSLEQVITSENKDKYFRHTIEIKGTNISLCFTTETTDNTPIDSLQDLISRLASTKLSCSGYIETNIVSKINIGATATAITFDTSGGNKTIASLGTITVEDDVTTL